MKVFQKKVKPYSLRVILALSKDLFVIISIMAALAFFFIEKPFPFDAIKFIAPFSIIGIFRSIILSRIAITQISILDKEIEICYMILNKEENLKVNKSVLTFIDFSGHKDIRGDRIIFLIDSKKELTQYFTGQFNFSDFDFLRFRLSEVGIKKPYGYNL